MLKTRLLPEWSACERRIRETMSELLPSFWEEFDNDLAVQAAKARPELYACYFARFLTDWCETHPSADRMVRSRVATAHENAWKELSWRSKLLRAYCWHKRSADRQRQAAALERRTLAEGAGLPCNTVQFDIVREFMRLRGDDVKRLGPHALVDGARMARGIVQDCPSGHWQPGLTQPCGVLPLCSSCFVLCSLLPAWPFAILCFLLPTFLPFLLLLTLLPLVAAAMSALPPAGPSPLYCVATPCPRHRSAPEAERWCAYWVFGAAKVAPALGVGPELWPGPRIGTCTQHCRHVFRRRKSESYV